MSDHPVVSIVGGGLAGSEAAFQLAERGYSVRLFEMKPHRRTPAQTGDGLAELVCSNSMRGAALTNAVGLLKEELRRSGSLMLRVADRCRVPAGGALAVDRERFSEEVTRVIEEHPLIERIADEVTSIPAERPVILATGPLTSDALAADLEARIGSERLAYYDAIAPIVSAESIDYERVFRQSRYDKGDADYINCPFTEPEYRAFVDALVTSEKVVPREFEKPRYFEGCLPCEVMAERGPDTLAYGPMKPVGLTDPRTGRRPFAVLQLRAEDREATAYNLVGFQTRMKYPEQQRVFRMIPGLENAEFLRMGSVHRNTFLAAPQVLADGLELKAEPGVLVAGQLAGVEGYVESAAGGFLAALLLAQRLEAGEAKAPHPPPATTALGALRTHMIFERPDYQPSNITWAHFPPLDGPKRRLKKRDRYQALADRALVDLATWHAAVGLTMPARLPDAPPEPPQADGTVANAGDAQDLGALTTPQAIP